MTTAIKLPETNNNHTNTTKKERRPDAAPLIDQLNLILADLHLHYMALRNFHWNVEGRSFFELHRIYEAQYNLFKAKIDDIAERVKMLGYYPLARFSVILDATRLDEPAMPLNAVEMNTYLVRNLKIMQNSLHRAIPVAAEAGDKVSEDMLIDLKTEIDEQYWMLTAWLK